MSTIACRASALLLSGLIVATLGFAAQAAVPRTDAAKIAMTLELICVWDALNSYRPPGQTSWCKALICSGADPRVALAGVLGVSAGDIWLRRRNGDLTGSRRGLRSHGK